MLIMIDPSTQSAHVGWLDVKESSRLDRCFDNPGDWERESNADIHPAFRPDADWSMYADKAKVCVCVV